MVSPVAAVRNQPATRRRPPVPVMTRQFLLENDTVIVDRVPLDDGEVAPHEVVEAGVASLKGCEESTAALRVFCVEVVLQALEIFLTRRKWLLDDGAFSVSNGFERKVCVRVVV